MKKLLMLVLMVFAMVTLVGCGSKDVVMEMELLDGSTTIFTFNETKLSLVITNTDDNDIATLYCFESSHNRYRFMDSRFYYTVYNNNGEYTISWDWI